MCRTAAACAPGSADNRQPRLFPGLCHRTLTAKRCRPRAQDAARGSAGGHGCRLCRRSGARDICFRRGPCQRSPRRKCHATWFTAHVGAAAVVHAQFNARQQSASCWRGCQIRRFAGHVRASAVKHAQLVGRQQRREGRPERHARRGSGVPPRARHLLARLGRRACCQRRPANSQ